MTAVLGDTAVADVPASRRTIEKPWQRWLIRLGVFIAMVILCLPGLWVVVTAFRPNVEVLARPTIWLPQNPTLDNFLKIFGLLPNLQEGLPVARYFVNSLVISISSTVVAILIGMMGGYAFAPNLASTVSQPTPDLAARSNTAALGDILYTDYVFAFQIAGLVLLVAMIGAIVLTHRDRVRSRHQVIAVQTARTMAETLEVVPVALGAGVKDLGIYRPKATEPEEVLADEDDGHGHAHGHGGHH